LASFFISLRARGDFSYLEPAMRVKKKPDFDPNAFLATIGEGRKFVLFPKKQAIFTQGRA
jgi:hypothetical protein